MPEVFIDGESIQFSGPPPTSLEDLLGFVEPALNQGGRVLAAVQIDGHPCEAALSAAAYQSAHRVDLTSVSVVEAVARVAAESANGVASLRKEMDSLADEVMRVAWTAAAPKCVAATEKLGHLLQEAGNLLAHPDIAAATTALAEGTESWIDRLGTADAAAVTIHLDRELLPMLSRLEAALRTAAKGAGA